MLTAILVDSTRWEGVPEERRQEWRLAIRELIDDHLLRVEASPLALRVGWDSATVRLCFEALSEGIVADIHVDRARLEQQMRAYVDVCRQLSALDARQASVAEVSALDQAKRDVHDNAARDLLRDLDAVGPSHDTARRLFTLLVVLLVDTTQLSVLQRPHGSDVVSRYHLTVI